MRIFLAGGISGNLNPFFREYAKTGNERNAMRIFLAGSHGLTPILTKAEDVYETQNCGVTGLKPYILESFFYMNQHIEKLIPTFGDFLLDSGAFTFMQGRNSGQTWDDYLKTYAEFINKHNIKNFFELDIDSVVGYKEVLRLREKLEKLTGRQCIPVWHKSRGKDEFLKMCDEYPYVAIGGIVSKEITSKEYKYFPWFIDEAHKRNAKIHGLGFTNLEGLKKYHFDSVDSSSWTTGNRFGAIYKFNGKTITKIDKPPNSKVKTRETAVNNFIEWVKFAQWADTHL